MKKTSSSRVRDEARGTLTDEVEALRDDKFVVASILAGAAAADRIWSKVQKERREGKERQERRA